MSNCDWLGCRPVRYPGTRPSTANRRQAGGSKGLPHPSKQDRPKPSFLQVDRAQSRDIARAPEERAIRFVIVGGVKLHSEDEVGSRLVVHIDVTKAADTIGIDLVEPEKALG